MIADLDPIDVTLWIGERRCHHGLVGAGLILAATIMPDPLGSCLRGIGAVLAWDDRADFPWRMVRRLV